MITGGAGFIGSNIARTLCEKYDVRVVDNLMTGKSRNIEPIKKDIEFVKADITNYETAKKSVRGVERVLHQAALPSVQRSVKDPTATNAANVTGTLNLLAAAREEGVRKFVYASSSSVYGDTPTLPKREDMAPNPKSPYAVSKLTGEYYCKVFSEVYGLSTISLRYFNVFGPRQDPSSQYAAVIPKFINAILKDRRPTIYGDGAQTRDFTYVENVVSANLLAMKARATGVFNIACGKRITINELVEKINALTGKRIKARYAEPREGDILHSLADISKAKKELRYEPRFSFEYGLKKTIEYFGGIDE